MKVISRSSLFKSVTALCLTMPLALSPAVAFTPSGNEVVDAFLGSLEKDNGKVESYGSVSESGDTITIENLVLSNSGAGAGNGKIASTSLTDGELQPDGGLKIGELAMSGLSVITEDTKVAAARFSATDVIMPKSNGSDAGAKDPAYSKMTMEDIDITAKEGNKVAIGRFFVSIDERTDDIATAAHFALEGLKVTAEGLNPNRRKPMIDLGYDEFTANIEGRGSWDPETATVDISELKISGENAGTLKVALSLGGFTRDLVMQLQVLQKHPEQAMGLSQGVSVKTISIRLDNDSLAERVLDMQARESGTDRATLVQQLTAALPMLVSPLQNPEFQQKVTAAATEFLNNPVSMTITATPPAPVPFSQILGQAMLAPQTLPQVLGVDVSANTPN